MFFEISAGSMSMWMNLALGANSASLPVMRSSKRAPIATIRSALSIAQLAVTVPCMPSIPSQFSSEAGKAPRPIRVEVTGKRSEAASSRSSSEALPLTTPPPV